MRILYLHGLHSQPGGKKPSYLLRQGFDLLNPALPDDDFDESVRRAQASFDDGNPDLVIGSSRGGAVVTGFAAIFAAALRRRRAAILAA